MSLANVAEQSLKGGDPLAALAQLQEQVRAKPADFKLRIFLFQLLCVLGQWERALNQLNVASNLDPSAIAMSQMYGDAIRCEAIRVGVFDGKTSPMIFGEGTQTRDYVYVDDVVTAFLCAADAPITTTGTFNIGTGVQTTVTELHQMIAAVVGVSRPPDHAEARAGEVHASAVDPTLAGRVLGWKPDTDLTDGIKRTVDWLRGLVDPRPAALAQV